VVLVVPVGAGAVVGAVVAGVVELEGGGAVGV
jgi:hypothetical protein